MAGFLVFSFIIIGCKHDTEYIDKQVGPRPTFNQVFAFFTLDSAYINKIKTIYDAMTDEELVDLKYNYYSAVPVFGLSNNQYNLKNTIYYQGNAIYIRGSVDPDNFEELFMAALEAYKNDALNKL